MSQTFVKRFSDLLENSQGKEALDLFATQDARIISSCLNEVVTVAVQYLPEPSSVSGYDQVLYECCKTVLNTVAETCNPMETVLELLVQTEGLKDDFKFFIILEPLGICLIKLMDMRKPIKWCFDTVKDYINQLPMLDDEDRQAIDSRNMKVHTEVVLFLGPLTQKTVKINSQLEDGSLLGDSLLSFVISLYGKPFCAIGKVTTETDEYKELLERMMALVSCLTGDALRFLDVVGKRYRNIIRDRADAGNSSTENYKRIVLFESSRSIPNVAYAHFYFHVITSEKYWRNVPQVYNLYYIFEKCMYLVYTLLGLEGDIFVWNGLVLMKSIVERIPHRSINPQLLELAIYLDIFEPIVNVMIYCANSVVRPRALNIFQEYIELFKMEARYYVLSHLYEITQHSGVLSLITGIFKSSIVECFYSSPRNYQFLGTNMEAMLKRICNLPHGSSTDLVEISDEIITALNLLRFLFIIDKHNEMGIWNVVNAIEDNYLKPLEQGIHMSKGHWTIKLKDLEDQRKLAAQTRDCEQMQKDDARVTLTIGGEQLPMMPISEKISLCHRIINGLDVMESILIRVNECIGIHRARLDESQ